MRTATVSQSGMDLGDPVPVAVAGRMPRQDSGCAGNLRNARIITTRALFAQSSREPGEALSQQKVKRVFDRISSRPSWNLSNRKGREEIRKVVPRTVPEI